MIKDKKWSLYRHTSPSGKVYIGITSQNPTARWQYGNGYKDCTIFWRAITKYGWKNIKHEVLFSSLSEERAKLLEISLIAHYKNLGISYNITNGGQGTSGLHKTEREKENLRKLRTGKKASAATRKKMSDTRKGRPGTMLGKKHSEETKAKMSRLKSGALNCNYGKQRSEEEKQIFRLAQKTRRKVAKVDPTTQEIIGVYDSINLAGKMNNCSSAHLADCCKGRTKLFKGYKWIFLDE